jgi:hypothetical protein
MVCENCSEENCDSITTCGSCGSAITASMPQLTAPSNIYATGPVAINRKALFHAKCGFPLQADVLPTIPVQTASAVAPMMAPAQAPASVPARRRTLSEISDLIADSQIGKETPDRAPSIEMPARSDRQEPWISRSEPEATESRLPLSRRKRIKPLMPITTPLQVGLVGSFITVSVAIVIGSVWSNKFSNDVRIASANFFSLPMQSTFIANAPEFASSNSHIKSEDKAPLVVAGIQPERIDTAAAPEQDPAPETQTPAPDSFKPPEPKGADAVNVSENHLVAPAKTSRKNIAARLSSSSTIKTAKAGPSSRSGRQAAGIARKERLEEIDRLKSQAFAETRKDRLDNVRVSGRSYAPTAHFSQQSNKRSNTNKEFLQCSQHSNFIHREQCKWRVCGGKWGRNGCPSYQTTETASY